MKLSNMIMVLVIIQAAIIMYDQVYSSDYELTAYDSNETIMWDFIADPTGWSSTALLIALIAIGAAGAAFIIVGTFLSTPSDTALFSPIFILLLGVGAIPIVSLYHVFTRNVALFGCTSMPCAPATWLWVFTGGIIGLFYILSVLEWWSGRSMG